VSARSRLGVRSASGARRALRIRGWALLGAACLLACAAAGAQEALSPVGAGYMVEEMLLLPPRFYVGDRVELRLRLRVDRALRLAEPVLLPEDPWIDLHGVQIDERRPAGASGEVRVRIFFSAFRPGATVLPTLTIGDLELAGIEVNTQSVLEAQEKPTLRGLRAPLRIPFTVMRILGVVAAVLAAPAAAVFAVLNGARGLRRLANLRRRRRPYASLQRSLQRLRGEADSGEGRDFFIVLSLSLKRYLSERLRRSVMSATTAEIQPQLAEAGVDLPLAREVHELLTRADLVKFSGRGGGRRGMQANLTRLERIAAKIEERYADVEL
jgi:hypothetical protein